MDSTITMVTCLCTKCIQQNNNAFDLYGIKKIVILENIPCVKIFICHI